LLHRGLEATAARYIGAPPLLLASCLWSGLNFLNLFVFSRFAAPQLRRRNVSSDTYLTSLGGQGGRLFSWGCGAERGLGMLFGDPDELKQEKALAFRTLTQELADLVGIVEHCGKIGPETIEDPEERKPARRSD
jgi:hypothetical protein